MKKKIKDLTLIEANKYCLSRQCYNCPFESGAECMLDYITGHHIEKWYHEVLEREVEIDESNND